MSRNTSDRPSRRDIPLGYIDRGSQRLHRAWSLLLLLALALSLASFPGAVVNAAPAPTLSIDDVTRAEGAPGNTTFVFTVTLSAPSTKPVKVTYRTANGTATANSDYNAVSGQLTVAGGQTTKTIAVTVRGDTTAEPDETFVVNLSRPSGATIADGQGVGTIQNDDGAPPPPPGPALSINDVTVTEGNSGTTTANFTVSLSAPAGASGVSFDIATADGTATTVDSDYVAQSLTGQTIAQDSQSYAFSVTVNGDMVAEQNETFSVNVTNVTGATVADGQGQATITNDDGTPPPPPGPTLSINDVTLAEGNSGTTSFVFTVSLAPTTNKQVNVDYATADGTATAGSDYQAASGTLTFRGGDTTKTFTVLVNGDTAVEANETFVVNLSNPSNAAIGDAQGQGTISTDDNQAPVAEAASATTTEDTASDLITLSASDADGDALTFAIATSPANGALSAISAPSCSGATPNVCTATVTYTPNGDYAGSDSFTYTASDAFGPSAAATVSITVTPVDDMPQAANDTPTVAEDAAATTIDVLANDTDVDGGLKSIDSVTQPANGSVVITNLGATLTYQPTADSCNNPPGDMSDSFTYTLTPGGATASVFVTVECVDDAPVAVDDSTTVVEDAATTTIDVLANDTDVDGGTKSILSVTQPANGTVAITNSGADLTYLPNSNTCDTTPDTFSYTLTPGGSTATVSVSVTCMDDVPHAVDDTASVLEDAAATTVDVLANDTDVDAGAKSIGAVTQGTNGAVAITNGGADLTYQPSADYCNTPPGTALDSFTYTLTPGSSEGTVAATVTCVNDVPSFTLPASPDQSVVENTSAQTVAGFATSMSAGPANEATQALTFNVSNDNTALFSAQPAIDEATGDLTYTPAANTTGTATVSVSLADDGGTTNGGDDTSATQTFDIMVRPPNADPVVTATTFSVAENSANGTSVGTVTATDSDAGQTRTFAITAGNTGDAFAINSTSGEITVADSAVLNFETTAQFLLTVSATDDGTPPASGSATITVDLTNVNEAPTDIALSNNSVAENQASGTTVGSFSTTDVDAASTHTYTLVAGTGDADNGSFTITGSTLKASASFDYETTSSYSIRVRSTDAGSLSFDEVFTITVTDANDAPTDITLAPSSVDENQASGTTVGTLSATDAETGQTYTFSLVTGVGDTDNAAFTIDSTTLKTAAVFDFETKSSYSVRVRATDNGTPAQSFEEQLTITVSNVNEAPTDITLTNSSVDENLPAATVGTLGATDPDAGQSFTFTLVAGTGDTDNGSFTIDGTTLKTAASFDYEAKSSYTILVRATDNGNLFREEQFTITILDVNDAPVLAAIEGTALSYTENDAATAVSPGITVSDQDSANLTGATVTISAGYVNGQDVLAFTNQLGITGSWDAVAGVLTLSGNASLADYQTALRAVTYANTSENPSTAARTISFKVNDGAVDSNVATRSVAVTAVNDAPVNTVPAAQMVNEDTDLTLSGASLISSADVDAGTNAVKLSLDVAHGTLTLASTSGLTFVDNTANGTGSVHVTGTIATINTALNGLKYKGNLNYNGADSLAVVTNDQGNTGTGGALSDSDSVAITVNAVNDAPTVTAPAAFTIQAHMQRAGLTGLLANVTDVDSGVNGCAPTFTVTNVSATTPANGTITNLNASAGTFDFDPPAGFTGGPVTFTYTVTDTGCPGTATSAPATVTFNVSGPVIWFVNPAAGTNGDGRLSNVFNSLASATSAMGTNTNHRIFVYTGTTASGTGVTLTGAGTQAAAQWLIGQGVSGTDFDSVMGISPPSGTIARPSIGGTRPTVQGTVTLGTNTVVKGVNISSSTATGLNDTAAAITGVSVDQVAVTTTTGTGVNLSDIAGTLTFTSLTTNGGTGASLSGINTGATFNFTAVSVSSGSKPGFEAIGGGTVNITGSTNTLASTSGTALNVTNTTIGASGLTFRSISATGGANGIVLNNTGTAAGLTVTGNGGTCTVATTSGCDGGTIQHTTGLDDSSATPGGTGIVLNNTKNVSLTRMWIHNHSNYGVRGTSVSGFTLANSVINGTNGTNDSTPYNDSSVYFSNGAGVGLEGTASVSDTTITGGYANEVEVNNTDGTLNLTFSRVTIGLNTTPNHNDGIQVEGLATSTVNVTVQSSTFTSAAGDLFQYIGQGSGGGNLVFTGNTLSNNHPLIATGGGGVTVSGGGAGAVTMNISNNTSRDSHTAAFTIVKGTRDGNPAICPGSPGGPSGSPGSLTATVANNTIGVAAVANSGSLEGSGIAVTQAGCGTVTMAVTNNQIRQYNNFGISLQAGAGIAYSGSVNFTVTGNTIANPGNNPNVSGFQGIALNSGVTPGDAYQTCAHISGNTATNSSPDGLNDLRVRARMNTTVRLPGYVGGNKDTTAVANFLLAQNTAVTASAVADATSGGFVGGAACATP